MMKQCSKCKKIKNIVDFSKNSSNKTDGKQSRCKSCNREYYESNKEREISRVKNWYYSNHVATLHRRRELSSRPEYKMKKAIQDKSYYVRTKKYVDANRAHILLYFKSWYTNPNLNEKIKNNRNNTLNLIQVESLFNKHPYCVYCGKYGVKLVLDHIIPISRGGQNCISNINIACEYCNADKGDKILEEWFLDRNMSRP